jgi:4-aminobutyrate aminotransferase-like enzyme
MNLSHIIYIFFQSLRYAFIGDVRGLGLFQGIEFIKKNSPVNDPIPHPELTKFLVDYMRYENVVVSRDGPAENVIKIKPPLVFSKGFIIIILILT